MLRRIACTKNLTSAALPLLNLSPDWTITRTTDGMSRLSCFYPEAPMAVPKSKISNSRRGQRRAHDSLTAANYVEDKDSGELRRQHHIDLKTGMYRGRQILNPQDD